MDPKNNKMDTHLRSIHEIATDLIEDTSKGKLTWFEAMQLAVQIQRNDIFVRAFVISQNNHYPGALEKIAMELEDLKTK